MTFFSRHTGLLSTALLPACLLLASCAHSTTSPQETASRPKAELRTGQTSVYPIAAMKTSLTRTVLPNGLEVLILPRPDLPLVSFRLGIRAGSASDPRGLAGTASLAAGLLVRGTAGHDTLSLFHDIDQTGGTLEASANRDMTVLSGDSLSGEAPILLGLAAEMVTSPTFPQGEFDKKKASVLASLSEEENHPSPIATELFYRLVEKGTPYATPPGGTPATVKKISRQNLLDFVRLHYRPDHSVLVLAGDLTPETGLALAKRTFSQWSAPSSSPMVSQPATFSPSPESGVFLVDKPELRQSTVFTGTSGIARKDPSFYNALVFNMLLGASQTSTLNRVVRQKMGLVYYIHSALDASPEPGPFIVYFQTYAKNTGKVLDSMHGILGDAIKTAPTPEAVDAIRRQLVGGFPFLMNTTPKLAQLLLVIWSDGLDYTYFTDYPNQVAKVTPASVLAAGQSLLKDKPFVTVVVGPAKALKKAGVTGSAPPPAD
ncbi:MAG: M16 family metallopeptidase [Leptospirales bacterium]